MIIRVVIPCCCSDVCCSRRPDRVHALVAHRSSTAKILSSTIHVASQTARLVAFASRMTGRGLRLHCRHVAARRPRRRLRLVSRKLHLTVAQRLCLTAVRQATASWQRSASCKMYRRLLPRCHNIVAHRLCQHLESASHKRRHLTSAHRLCLTAVQQATASWQRRSPCVKAALLPQGSRQDPRRPSPCTTHLCLCLTAVRQAAASWQKRRSCVKAALLPQGSQLRKCHHPLRHLTAGTQLACKQRATAVRVKNCHCRRPCHCTAALPVQLGSYR